VIYKFGSCERGTKVLGPHQSLYIADGIQERGIDGVKPPAYQGDWYKVLNGVKVVILSNGDVLEVEGIGLYVPDFKPCDGLTLSRLGNFICSHSPGRKLEPVRSQISHPDWQYPRPQATTAAS
jgi:hypothetical protein